MVGIFKANNPFNTFLLFIYGLLLKLAWFLHPHIPVVQKTDGFFFRQILAKLEGSGAQFPLIYPAITYFLLFTQAITFNKLINDQKMMQRSNYLPAMSYLLITSMFSEWNVLTAPLVINTLLIWVWARMSTLYSNLNPKSTLFNIGIMIGVSTFFYFPSLAFVLLIVFALIVSRPFRLAEWVVSFLGIVTPYYFLFSYLFLTDKLQGYKLPQFEVSYPRFHQNYWELAGICLIVLAFLIGGYFVQANFRKQLVQVRKRWSLLLLYLVVAVFVPFINATHTFEYWILTAIPLSAYVGCGFLYPVKRWLPLTLHWLMVVVVFVISYGLK
ncbi:MAG: hypothetical protein JWN83_2455 [Chitinophagaceae bacterium]|nr:hypothetical protein [Chitinophagaceae bacterium]